MDRYKETFETWNNVALLYQEKFMNLDLYNTTYDFICNSIIKAKAEILEIGCGPGNITKYLLSKRPDFNIYGIDIAPKMIELARKNNPTANFNAMDIRHIGDLSRKFDGIVCGFCLPYLSEADCEKLILDVRFLLNDSGLLYISFVEGDPNKSDFQVSANGNRSYFYYHTLGQLKKQLYDNSFEEILIWNVEYKKTETVNEIHTIVTAKKKKTA